jgi:hypothetical protein
MSRTILTRRTALRGLTGGSLALALGGCTTALTDVTAALQSAGGTDRERQIGFDLWSGVPGSRFGDRIDKRVGSRRIVGPRTWRHPITGESLTVDVRENRERDGGVRIRYLTMNDDGDLPLFSGPLVS